MITVFFHKKFDSQRWKSHPEKRKYYLKDLLARELAVGKTYKEIKSLLGNNESRSVKHDRWTYSLYTNATIHRKYFLVVYFENGKSVQVRKEFKIYYL